MNEPEKETVKKTIKELIELTKDCRDIDDNGGALEFEKRLKAITDDLIDML